ncbi:MAG: hypothetical protein LBJ67_13320 [Planctomycetaceae bacterium]|jgi:hypothetical protein|nr:hypothetical protein [Planctomycetaceae bacterium]
MKNDLHFLILAFLIFVITAFKGYCQEIPSSKVTPPTVQELVKKMMDYRKSVNNGKIIVKVKWIKNPDINYQGAEGIFRFYFKPDCLRKDSIFQFQTGQMVMQYVKTPIHAFWRSGGGKDFPCQYTDDVNFLKSHNDVPPTSLMALGTCPCGISTYDSLDLNHLELCPLEGRNFQIVYDKANNMDTWKVTYQIGDELANRKNSYWVIPQMGYSMIRFESEQSYSNGDTIAIHYTLQAKQFNNIWFPKEIHYQLEENGKITHEEIQTINEAKFNQSLDDKEFALEKLEIPQGTEVAVNGKLLKYWNGEKLSDYPSYPLPKNDKMTTQRR